MRRSYTAVSCLLATLAAFPAQASAQACLPFRTALEESLDYDPRIETAAADREAARAGVLAAYSRNLPQISLFGQLGLGNTQPIDNTRDDQVGVQVQQELYTFGQRAANQAAARAQLDGARHGVAETKIDIAEGAALAYLDVLRAQAIAGLATEQEAVFGRDAELAASRLARRVITLTDASQIRARYAISRSETTNARVEAEAALVRLSALIDRPVECLSEESATGFLGAEAEAVLSLSLEVAMDRALRRSYTIKRARAGIRSATATLSEAKRANLPTVSANAFALYQDDPSFGQESEEGRIGFSIRQDLYAGGRNKARSMDARARLRGARAEADLQRLVLKDRVGRALARAKAARSAGLSLLEASREARIQLDATTREYERGTKTVTDLVFAIEDYYGAASRETDARYAFYSSLVSLYAALGILVDPIEG